MIVYPLSEQTRYEEILKKFPYSRVSTQKVSFEGKVLVSVRSTDLDLMNCIAETFSINRNPKISRL